MKKLALTAAIAALFAACSSDSDFNVDPRQDTPQTAENAVKFSTYMGRTNTTRGGAYGSIDTEKLGNSDYGFGVFAYFTGTADYAGYRTQGASTDHYPNFMYNEHIIGDGSGAWKYKDVKNTKYWPNDFSTNAVDDQNNDTGNDPATGSVNGGKVSFFAYAPYAAEADNNKTTGLTSQSVSASDHEGTNYGIIAFSGNAYNGTAGEKYSDPYLKYHIAKDNDKQVDLLWGTTGTNGFNVAGQAQNGVSYNVAGDDYQKDILEAYALNADLTKQKTNGTVNFLFKHALAKVGGSYVGGGDGSDEDAGTATNGLMVVLDIDKEGKEVGGSLQPYAEDLTKGEHESDDDFNKRKGNNKYNTKVTINSIELESGRQLKEGIDITSSTFDYSTDTEGLNNIGIFDLATGKWSDFEKSTPIEERKQTIYSSGANVGDQTDADNSKKDAVLHENIAEPTSWSNAHTKAAFEALPIGVTTVPKNVYASEAQPFVFIPGTKPVVKVTIDYTVRTYDAKLANKYTEVRQKITKALYINDELQLNKQYNILMHLGLTGVKFTATVSDWDVTGSGVTGGTDDDTDPITVEDNTLEHVYLPINVAGVTAMKVGTADATKVDEQNYTYTMSSQPATTTSVTIDPVSFHFSDGKIHTTYANDAAAQTELSSTTAYGDKAFFSTGGNLAIACSGGFDGAAVTIGDDGKLNVTLPENNTYNAVNYDVTLKYNYNQLTIVIPQSGRLLSLTPDHQTYTITAPTDEADLGKITPSFSDGSTVDNSKISISATNFETPYSLDGAKAKFTGRYTQKEIATLTVSYGTDPNSQTTKLHVTKNAGEVHHAASDLTVKLTQSDDTTPVDLTGAVITITDSNNAPVTATTNDTLGTITFTDAGTYAIVIDDVTIESVTITEPAP